MTSPTDRTLTPDAQGGSRSALRTSLLVGLCCFIVYNANLRSISAGDTYPARYLPFAVLQHHTLFLNPVARVAAQGRGDGAYWMLPRPDGRFISLYPVVTPLLVSPLYVPAIAYLNYHGWTDARLDFVAKVMEKVSASLVAALSAALLYVLVRRRAGPRTALILTAAYALGTTTWVVSSQALWQHGVAEFLIIAALLALTGQPTLPSTLAAGVLIGLIGSNRPPDVILAAPLGLYGLVWAGQLRRRRLLTAAAALPMLAVVAYNLYATGNVGGGYGLIGSVRFFEHDLFVGVTGLLVSPTRGLLFFSPFFVFLVFAWRHLPQERAERGLVLGMAAAVVMQVVMYAKSDWRSGLSWGPRYLTDLLPFLIWILVPVVAALRGMRRLAFHLTVAAAIAMQAVGAFAYSDDLDLPIYANDRGYKFHDMRPAFEWRNNPVLRSLRRGPAPADLTAEPRGHIDAIETPAGRATAIAAGEKAWVIGWALTGDETPWQVAINIDGRDPEASKEFFDRPDVRETLGAKNKAGWRIPLKTAGLAPGVHKVSALVWGTEAGQGHYLAEFPLTIHGADEAPPPDVDATRVADLDASAATAAGRVREHQHESGYWLTAFTRDTRFRDPQPEMNTFMTALLVDLLNPMAATPGLEPSLERARRHLTDQIEAGGLVRYHGLPDGPGIGTLGCAITPDTDNTALVWRLAPPPDRSRLASALATLDQYRTADGLYKTWLAPQSAYQCLDPGDDPDPADIVIQVHLLQLLSAARPPAARALCGRLRTAASHDRVWVYYRKAPLLPILRMADLDKAGCSIAFPESRLGSDVSGQQLWVTVARMLAGRSAVAGAPPEPGLVRAVLRELSRDDFALVRQQPPLLYHNDLTATVPRYYWSEDVGYALWLRLYGEYQRLSGPPAS